MFILRFIGRILSIGFILFIAFIVTGKNSKADSTWVVGEPAVDYRVVHKVEMFAIAVRPSSLRR
ncbi:MAG: hypothetical protein OER43_01435 [Gammaproteobacteria bacterium]|nr:hypothetical protein [Gammaproteobacteria bacterium]MDH3411892.1 hypothetical protein [Gammaproteobacteria bacterium]